MYAVIVVVYDVRRSTERTCSVAPDYRKPGRGNIADILLILPVDLKNARNQHLCS